MVSPLILPKRRRAHLCGALRFDFKNCLQRLFFGRRLRLYCIRLFCIRLYCIRLYCIRLYCIRLYCIRLYCIRLYCLK